ncbi:MAG: hemolysin family protein [Aggregatilineales bacterium]
MDDSSGPISLIIILLAGSALLTLAYSALKNSRPAQLAEQAEGGSSRAKQALRLLNAETHLDISYQLALTLIRFSIAALLALLLVGVTSGDDAILTVPAAIILFLFISALLLIPGELLPEGTGSRFSDNLSLTLLPLLRFVILVLSPLTWLILGLSYLFSRLSGSEAYVNTVTEEEIMTLVNASYTGGAIEDEEQRMIYSVLQLDNSSARELMTPRIDVIALAIDAPIKDALATFIETGFSRIPVYEDNVDDIVGLLYAKDLLEIWQDEHLQHETQLIRDMLRTVHYIPEDRPADKVLVRMRDQKIHMAVVEDEYGGTSGVITIEDLIEEIIGDIQDEHDSDELIEYEQLSEDEYLVEALMDLDDLNDLLDTNFDTDANDTLGGFIFMRLGRVPEAGEVLETAEVRLVIQSLDGRRIRKVHLTRLRPSDSDDNENIDTLIDSTAEILDEKTLEDAS